MKNLAGKAMKMRVLVPEISLYPKSISKGRITPNSFRQIYQDIAEAPENFGMGLTIPTHNVNDDEKKAYIKTKNRAFKLFRNGSLTFPQYFIENWHWPW